MKLFEKLLSVRKENLISFHVPGHKYTKVYNDYFGQINSILDIDITEIPGTDDLFNASTCIMESQKQVKSLIGSLESYFLVGGTTSGIYAMIMAATEPGDTVLIARDCHRAVYDGVFLGHLNIRYIEPFIYNGMSLGITPENVELALREDNNVKALILTYPNYYGVGTDLEAIRGVLDYYDVRLLVDEAHGAHLFLNDTLMPSAIDLGADIVVQSSHKSLPVMTQGSVLHLNSNKIDKKKLEFMLKVHQTSSPSYVLMSSLDIGYEIAKNEGGILMIELLKNIKDFKKTYPIFLEQSDLPKGFVLDPTKLTLLGEKYNVNPIDFEEQLRKKGVQIEFSNDKFAVFVTSIMNQTSDFDYLSKIMEMLKFKCYSGIDNTEISYKSEIKMSISNAFYSIKESVNLEQALNCIVADYIIPYPPGIPLMVPGELIDKNKLELIMNMLDMKINIIGLNDKSDGILVVSNKEVK